MTLRETLKSAESRLRAKRIPDPRAEAEFLVAGVLGIGRGELLISEAYAEAAEATEKIETALKKRLTRMPLAYVLGNQPFCDVDLLVKPGVLIPRPETEQLAELSLTLIRRCAPPSPGSAGRRLRVLDLCAGSGAIAITLAKKLPEVEVVAVELSAAACRVAKANVGRNGVAVRVLKGDLFSPLKGERGFDIIVSNPPYVPSARIRTLAPEVRREPALALDGGADGLDVIRRIVAGAPERLNAGGRLLLEMDPGQTRPVARLMKDAGFTDVQIVKDFSGKNRIVSGVSHGCNG